MPDQLQPVEYLGESPEALSAAIVAAPDDPAVTEKVRQLAAAVAQQSGVTGSGPAGPNQNDLEALADTIVGQRLKGISDGHRFAFRTIILGVLIGQRDRKEPASTARPQPSNSLADPVEHYRGEFVHEATDLVVRGAGIDFAFHRTYRHQTIHDGPLGHRWDHGYNLFLRVDDREAVLSMGGGRTEVYRRHDRWEQAGFTYYVPPDGVDATLEPVGVTWAPSGWIRRGPDGLSHVFEPDPDWSGAFRLAEIRDRWSNYLAFTYAAGPSGIPRLAHCQINSAHRWVDLAYDQHDRIVRVSDHTGRAWRYAYDAHGDLVRVIAPGTPRPSTTEYRYTSGEHTGPLAHLLTDVFDAAGRHYLHTEYGVDRGTIEWNRVTRQRLGTGDYWFRYEAVEPDGEDPTVEDRPLMRCWVKERSGYQTLYVYNAWGALLWKQETDKGPGHAPRQVVWRYRYNRDGALTASRTPEGVVRHLLTGRDHFYRVHGADHAAEPWLDEHLTADLRRGFGRVLATVDRAAPHTAAILGWADRWGDVYAVGPDDLIVKHTYEPVYGQPLTTSDPRATAASDPRVIEDSEHERLLTRYEYDGPSGDSTRDLVRVIGPAPTLPDGTIAGAPVAEILERDPRGRVTRVRNAAAVESTTEYFTSDAHEGFVFRTTVDPGDRALGKLAITTERIVDDLGRVTTTVLPRGVDSADGRFFVATEYDEHDRAVVAHRATPLDTSTRTSYEQAGKPKQIEIEWTDPYRVDLPTLVRRFHYDEEHRVTKETFGGSDVLAHRRIAHRYGANGLVSLTVQPNDHTTQWRYDSRDLLARTIRGAGIGQSVDELTRDRDGRVIEHRSPEGRTTRTAYDGFGRVIAVTDALGNVTRTSYDRGGRPTVVRVFERRGAPGTAPSYVLLARTETFYDELGRPARQRVARFDDPPPGVSLAEVDTAFEAAGPGVALDTQTFLDALGRAVRVVDPLGYQATTDYDAAGRVVRVTDPTGNRAETTYDVHGNPVRADRFDVVRDLAGAVLGEEVITSFAEYDERDRRIRDIDPLGNVTTHEYDSLDREVRTTDPLGNVTERVFDEYGNLVEVRAWRTTSGDGTGDPLAPHVVRYQHDRAGLVIARIDALGRRTDYVHDKWDRVIEERLPDGARIATQYDRDSLVTAVRDAHGVVVRHEHDVLGRPIRTLVDDSEIDSGLVIGGDGQIDRIYDALGRLTSATTATCAINARFDSLGRPIGETTAIAIASGDPPVDLTIARAFDDAGRLTGLTYPGGRALAHVRHAAGRLTSIHHVADGAGYPGTAAVPRTIIQYAYAGGRVREMARANGNTTTIAFDPAGRAIGIDHAEAGGDLLSTFQQLRDGARAPRLRLEKSVQSGAERFGYDSRYQITARTFELASVIDLTPFAPPAVPPVGVPAPRQALIDTQIGARLGPDVPPNTDGWIYDLAGNRETALAAEGSPVGYGVDDRDRYTSVGGVSRDHDGAGNLTADGAFEYVYDGFRRVVAVRDRTTGVEVASYAYDPLGRRVIEQHGTDRLVIAYDGPDRIADYRSGACVAQYVHGPHVDDPVELAVASTEYTYLTDFQGSVRLLTTVVGNSAAEYRYDPFGVLAASLGPDLGAPGTGATQPFGYASRPFDPVVGLYDFRARLYAPALGRFIQRDPAGPVDGHLYNYAGNHPLAFGDPSGLARFEFHGGQFVTLPEPTVALPSASTAGRPLPLFDPSSDRIEWIGLHDAREHPDYVSQGLTSVGAPNDLADLGIRGFMFKYAGGDMLNLRPDEIDYECNPCRDPVGFVRQEGHIFPVDAHGRRMFDPTNTPAIVGGALTKFRQSMELNDFRLRVTSITFQFQILIALLAGSATGGPNHLAWGPQPLNPGIIRRRPSARPVRKGPIKDQDPHNLTEQLTMAEARSTPPGTEPAMTKLGDTPRLEANYGPGPWVKMEHVHPMPNGQGQVNIHWFRNESTGRNVEFKFKIRLSDKIGVKTPPKEPTSPTGTHGFP